MLFLFAFFSLTLSSAIRDIATKHSLKSIDGDVLAGWIGFLIFGALLPYVLWVWIPHISLKLLGVILLDGGLYFSGKYFNFTALKLGDISYISPLKWLTTVSIILTEFLVFWTLPNTVGIFGILLIFSWAYIVWIKKEKKGILAPVIHIFKDTSSQIYLITVVCYWFTAVLDKVGVGLSNPTFWVCIMNGMVFAFSLRKIYSQKSQLRKIFKLNAPSFLTSSLLNLFTQVSQMYLITMMYVSFVSAFKSASSVLSVILWGYLFREKHLGKRFLWAIFAFIGILLISFFGG